MNEKELDSLLRKVLTIPLSIPISDNSLICYGTAIKALKLLNDKLLKLNEDK